MERRTPISIYVPRLYTPNAAIRTRPGDDTI